MLSSLEIKNFRTFSHLVIERLGRVNLIVGKNNVGKTTLLEALRLYGSLWPPTTITSHLRERNELVASSESAKASLSFDALFHKWKMAEGSEFLLAAGEGSHERLLVRVHRHEEESDDDSESERLLLLDRFFLRTHGPSGHFRLEADGGRGWMIPGGAPRPPDIRTEEPCFVQRRFSMDVLARWWDAIGLTDAETRVIEALRLFHPVVERISFVAHPGGAVGRVPMARIGGISHPVSLVSLGDGVTRALEIAVAMEYAAARIPRRDDVEGHLGPDFLLIDEVENGLHHSLHADIWKFIFRLAKMHDLQVFATTHSHDCLRGFAQAVAEDEEADGQVIRLERDADEEATRAIVVSREKLPIVVRDSIEVR